MLHFAERYGHAAVITALCEHDADVNAQNNVRAAARQPALPPRLHSTVLASILARAAVFRRRSCARPQSWVQCWCAGARWRAELGAAVLLLL